MPIDIIDLLNYFGINRQSSGPLLVAGILFYWFFRSFAEKPLLAVKKQVSDVKDAVCEMQIYLTDTNGKNWQHNMRSIQIFGRAQSPMVPNELGNEILEESGFLSIYPGIKARVFPLLDARNTRTLYDAEKNSQAILHEIANDPLFDNVKSYVVNNPNKIPDLDIIFGIASWLLRDEYGKMRNIEK